MKKSKIIHKKRSRRVIANRKPDIFVRLKKHPHVLCVEAEDIVHINWFLLRAVW